MQYIFKNTMDVDIKIPFDRLTYKEAMERYGSDKPDTRFGMEIELLNDLVADCEFKVFSGAIANGGVVSAINAKGSKFSRKTIDKLTDTAKLYGAKGLAWIAVNDEGIKSPMLNS